MKQLEMDVENTSPNALSGTTLETANKNNQAVEGNALDQDVVEVPEEVPDSRGEEKDTENHKDRDLPESNENKCKKDVFLSPMSLPLMAKPVKKQDSKPSAISMSFKSKFAIPADIYKAPKVAAFMAEMPPRPKKEPSQKEECKEPSSEEKAEIKSDKPKPKPPPAKFTYDEPDWSATPEDKKYSIEVLKMGAIVDNVDLSGKEYFVVGRLTDCDIKMDHPSISRYHAVLQYGAPGSDSESVELQKDGSHGFYVYDLGSTHGTMINKQNIRSKIFYRIKVGHVLKFGGSTRLFILQGPSDDQEEEAKESASELREYNRQKIKKKKDLEKMMLGEDSSSDEEEDGKKKKRNQRNLENSEVTWGMLEDAVESSGDEEEQEEEEEGDTRADHPDAILVQTKKDPFYMKDPLKALKNLYEREKMELDFECNERRSGHWHVKLSLPVDDPSGKPVYSEVNATGKKKDTIRQCALEACRILEKHGLFRRKDHHKVKVKQWEKDDFYGSDEDEFDDRTGELEMKRKMRMQRAGKKSATSKVVETYESLLKQVTDLDNEMKDIEMKLQKDKEATKVKSDAVDPLDAFMQQVKSGKALDTTTRAKLKRRLIEAKREHMRVMKLADLARPSTLPPLASSSKTYSFIGKMKGKKKTITKIQPALNSGDLVKNTLQKAATEEEIVEEEEDEGKKTSPISKQTKIIKLMDIKKSPDRTVTDNSENSSTISPVINVPIRRTEWSENDQNIEINANEEKTPLSETGHVKLKDVQSNTETEKPTQKRVLGPTLPPELKVQLQAEQVEEHPVQEVEEETISEPKRKRRRQRKPRQSNTAASAQYSDDPKYSVWLPPENQSGDGKTSLNEKLGY